MPIVIYLKKNQILLIRQVTKTNITNPRISLIVSIMSLAGLPPFTGFIPKLIVLKTIINTEPLIILPLLLATLISLFFYLRLTLITIINPTNFSKTKKRKNVNKESIIN